MPGSAIAQLRRRVTAHPASRVALLTLVVLLGLVLRSLGIRLGLPYAHHWDEDWIVDNVVHMLVTQSNVPDSYNYGAPMSLLGVDVYAAYTRLVHDFSPTDGIKLRLLVRPIGVAISTSGIVATYLAARWGDPRAHRSARGALAAALLYAVASELVTHARYAVTDASLVALTAWTLAFTARYVRQRRLRWAVAAVLAAGVTFAFKVSALPTAWIPLLALATVPSVPSSARSELARRMVLLAAVPAVVVTFFALNPNFVTEDHYGDAMKDVVERVKQTRVGGFPDYQLKEAGLPHLLAALRGIATLTLHRTPWLSAALCGVALVGLGLGLRQNARFFGIVASHAAVAILFMALPNRAYLLRNYLVTVPALCLGFGVAVREATTWLGRRAPPLSAASWLVWAPSTAAAALVLLWMPVRDAIACQALAVDPRQRAIDWVATHGGKGTRAAFTPSVIGEQALGQIDGYEKGLHRAELVELPAVKTCEDVSGSGAAYVVTASYRSICTVRVEDVWFFQSCPGYREVARFEPNPYEHNFAVTPAWDGRVTALVLAKVGDGQSL